MATQSKYEFGFQIRDFSTSPSQPETGVHDVRLQPITSTYPTNAITCTHLGDGWYIPDSDPDEDEHYDIYVDGAKKRRRISDNSFPGLS